MRVDVYCNQDYCDDHPNGAEITFTKELIERIIELSGVVTKVNVASISEYDNTPVWLNSPDENEPWDYGNLECGMMVVGQDHVCWNAIIKHMNAGIETEAIYIKELKEIYEVLSTPLKDLPLLIGIKSEEAKNILERRLKNETVS